MKHIFTLLLLSCLTWGSLSAQKSQITVLSQTADETVLRVEFAPLSFQKRTTPQGEAWAVQLPDGTPLLSAGQPDLPKLALPILLPHTGQMAVEVLSEEGVAVQNRSVAPSKGNFKRNIDPSTVPYTYSEEYQKSAFFPNHIAQLKATFTLRDARGQSLWVFPAQYNPVSQTLRSTGAVTLRIYRTAAAGDNETPATTQRGSSPAFYQLYQKLFVNFDAQRLTASLDATQPEKMLIIAANSLVDDIEPFAQWKRQTGIHTTVVSMSEVGTNTPSQLYNYVRQYYEANGITYLMLVGDEFAIEPMLRPGSDYSCDNCLGYMSGSDHLPEIFVGRFHASNPEQLRIMMLRNEKYEKTPLIDTLENWCATAMASCSNEGEGIGDDGQADFQQSNEWKTKHLEDGYEKIWEFYDGNHADISPTPGSETADQPGNPANTMLVNLMNGRGVGLYNYTGHGWEQGLVSGNFDVGAVAALRNEDRYPIIIAVACCAGHFTTGECLGEALQRAGNDDYHDAWGAVMAYFSSDFQSWAPPMEGQDGMNQYLTDADGTTLFPRTGAMAAYGNALMIAAYQQAGEDMADVWNPFGEPALIPRTRLPQVMTATHAESIFLGSTTLTVNCPVEGAQIGLFFEGQTLAVASVENGVAILEFPPLASVGNLVVTGTQFNYVPYQGSMVVVPASGPYLVRQAMTINDLAANNNAVAEYNETYQYDLTLANVGLEPATATVATLSVNDPYIEILDGTENAGDIMDSTSVVLPGAFTCKVAPYIPDGHITLFSLTLNYSNGDELTYYIQEKINAPKMEVPSYTIVEGPGSDNDGKYESGETIVIGMRNLNSGHSVSPPGVGTLTADSPALTITAPVDVPEIAANGIFDAFFTITIGAGIPPATTFNLSYQMETGDYNAEKQLSPIVINPIIENFESQNFNGFPWTMSGNKPWVITNVAPYHGQYCVRSGQINHSQQSNMSMTIHVLEDGQVSFARRTGCEADFDFLRFYIDEVVVGEWSGSIGWGEVAFPVTAGVHTLRWSYQKDQFGTTTPDRAYVDEISLPPHVTIVSTQQPVSDNITFEVYPNPANDQALLLLDVAETSNTIWSVSDAQGKIIKEMPARTLTTGEHQWSIDTGEWPEGIYMISIRHEKGIATRRLTVVHR